MRRKGEQKVDHWRFYQPYGPAHPVAGAIASGSQWFQAWQMQYGLTLARLERLGIAAADQFAIARGGPIRRSQIVLIAGASCVHPEDVIASLPDPALLIED